MDDRESLKQILMDAAWILQDLLIILETDDKKYFPKMNDKISDLRMRIKSFGE